MQYLIGKGMSISVDDNSVIDQNSINQALFILTGFTPINTGGFTVWENGRERYWAPSDAPDEDIEAITEELNAKAIVPSLDADFAQRLLRLVPMAINPIVLVNGRLIGGWQVESNPMPSDGDIMTNGHQSHSYQHTVLPMAIAMVFLQAQGIGQQAWIYTGEHDTATPELHYVVPLDSNLKVLENTPTFIRAPDLDQFAAVGVPLAAWEDALTTGLLTKAARTPA